MFIPFKSSGREVIKDNVRQQPVTPRSSSTIRLRSRGRSYTPNQELIAASSLLRRFSFNDLKFATSNFKYDNLLGEGGFGSVFKGWVDQDENYATKPGIGIPIAVKTLNLNGLQGHKEWLVCDHTNPGYISLYVSYLFNLHHFY